MRTLDSGRGVQIVVTTPDGDVFKGTVPLDAKRPYVYNLVRAIIESLAKSYLDVSTVRVSCGENVFMLESLDMVDLSDFGFAMFLSSWEEFVKVVSDG